MDIHLLNESITASFSSSVGRSHCAFGQAPHKVVGLLLKTTLHEK